MAGRQSLIPKVRKPNDSTLLGPAVKVGKSGIDGRGAFALRPLPARKKLGDMTGPIIPTREARRRVASQERIFCVELDERRALDLNDAGDLRFVNHSCAPNAYLRISHERVEFYALRDIAVGEEITVDYGETHHDGKLPCRCGAEACRGFI